MVLFLEPCLHLLMHKNWVYYCKKVVIYNLKGEVDREEEIKPNFQVELNNDGTEDDSL